MFVDFSSCSSTLAYHFKFVLMESTYKILKTFFIMIPFVMHINKKENSLRNARVLTTINILVVCDFFSLSFTLAYHFKFVLMESTYKMLKTLFIIMHP